MVHGLLSTSGTGHAAVYKDDFHRADQHLATPYVRGATSIPLCNAFDENCNRLSSKLINMYASTSHTGEERGSVQKQLAKAIFAEGRSMGLSVTSGVKHTMSSVGKWKHDADHDVMMTEPGSGFLFVCCLQALKEHKSAWQNGK